MTQKDNAEAIIAFVSSNPNASVTDTQLHCEKLGISRGKFHEALNSRVCKSRVKKVTLSELPHVRVLQLKEVKEAPSTELLKPAPAFEADSKVAMLVAAVSAYPHKTTDELVALKGKEIGGDYKSFSSLLAYARSKARVFSKKSPNSRALMWATTPFPHENAARPKAKKYIRQSPKPLQVEYKPVLQQGELTLNLLDTENIDVTFMATRFMMGHQDDAVFKSFYIQAAREYFSKMQASLNKA